MDAPIVAAVVGGLVSLGSAVFAYRSSALANEATKETNRITSTKVDGEAYERSQKFYEGLIANGEKERERLQTQVDRQNDLIARGQDRESTLVGQIRALQTQVTTMEQTMLMLRMQGLPPGTRLPGQYDEDKP